MPGKVNKMCFKHMYSTFQSISVQTLQSLMLIDFNFAKLWKHPDRPPLTAFACSTVSRLRVKTHLVRTGHSVPEGQFHRTVVNDRRSHGTVVNPRATIPWHSGKPDEQSHALVVNQTAMILCGITVTQRSRHCNNIKTKGYCEFSRMITHLDFLYHIKWLITTISY